MEHPQISLVVPIFDERENIAPLYEAITAEMAALHAAYEIVLVDDGSRDGSVDELRRLAARDARVKLVLFRRNFGQTAALNAGMHLAAGDVIVTLDADLQNDPADIPALLAKLDEGYDLVHGWRQNRQDGWLRRKLPSRLANWLISRVTGFPVRDLGCTLKAMRREIAQDLELFGEMHRFIPILADARGARCVEVPTRHHPRRRGSSKYGLSRTLRVLLDLLTVKYIVHYQASPMKLFGGVGLGCWALGALAAAATLAMKAWQGTDVTGNPLFMLAAFAGMMGGQFLVMGMLGELCARIYFEGNGKPPYVIRETVNFAAPTTPLERRAA